ncbi:MAG: hypothetical protein Q7R35_12705 [Elusimicrobiota bacterium]|nr:hypothetical protein [Elusimicrobiota bacterium]
MTNEETLKRVTAAGLEKCLLKITEVSRCDWQLAGVRVFSGKVRDAVRRKEGEAPAGAAVRIKIRGATPFITAILFNPEDIAHISRCFAEESFYGPLVADQPDVAIVEIGNILLNALANSLLRAFKKSAIPSVPAYFRGEPGAVEEWLGAGPVVFTIVSAAFTMQREGRTAAAEILAFLPPPLAAEAPPGK